MTKLTYDKLYEFVNERIEFFKKEDNAISCFNAELQTIGDYNGRQILELIQNADDAGATNISFQLNSDRNELIFFNNGDSFSLEGIKSIMIAYYSSKVTSSYIGNKGLGFRSILNWAESVSIYSAGLKIEFSRKVLEEYLADQLTDMGKNLNVIRENRNLSQECIPIPILGLPRVSTSNYDGCDEDKGCALVIVYNKDKETDVINQVNAIDERTLLFLQHIQNVEIVGFSDAEPTKSISVHKDEWEIHSKDEELEDKYQDKNKREKRKYIVKIAIPQNGLLEGNSPLYNYLPSKEKVHLPFLLHATVELNSSRNHVNESEVNDYILQKAAELIREVAKKRLDETSDCSDWFAFRLMTPSIPVKDYGSLKALYDKLDELKKDMAIYPTIDGKYVTVNDYYYYNDDISGFWKDVEVKGISFSKMLQPVGGDFSILTRPLANIVDAITDVSGQLKGDIPKRVSLIRHLFDNKGSYFNGQKVPLLIDDNDNTIEGEAYVQDSGNNELTKNLPDWVEFSVVRNDLVKSLIDEFQTEIEAAKQQKKQDGMQSVSEIRCLVGLLDFFTNVGYFDKTGIANKVIGQANAKLEENETDKQKLIDEMLNFLCNLGSDSELKNVRLLSEEGTVMKATELMLPTELNKQVFEGTDIQYVLGLDVWKEKSVLAELDEIHFNEFMKKLGVNRVLGEKKFKDVFYLSEYHNYLESHQFFSDAIGCSKNDLFKGSEDVAIPVIRDSIMNRLEKASLQNVLRFVSSSEEILQRLKESIELWFFYNRNWRKIETLYNYVRFQLSTLDNVKWKVFGTDLILDSAVDVDDFEYNAQNVVELIRTDFRYETTKSISKFLNDCPSHSPNGKNIRKLYKLVIDGLDERGRYIADDVQLYASDVNGNKGYHTSKEVFYSDNTCLPKEVIEKAGLFRLDYPSRQGVDKITGVFRLYSLNDLSFEINSSQESNLSKEFNSFFEQLKPYFLLYVIQNASKQTSKKQYADEIKNFSICLVSQCKYSIKGQECDLEDGEFVNVGNRYYLNVNGLSSMEEMKLSTTYCNAVAEILGMVFKLETKNEHFIHVFQGFDFMKKYLNETRKDEIAECFKLLGISPEEKVFWEKYGELKEIQLDFESLDFYSSVGINEEVIKKVNFSQWDNQDSINFLNEIMDKLEEDKKQALLDSVDLSLWHKLRFETIKTEYHKAFVHLLWTLLNGQYKNMRSKYFALQDVYSKLELNADGWKHELKEPDDYYDCLNKKVNELLGQNGMSTADKLDKDSCEEHDNLYPNIIHSIQEEKDMEDQRWLLYFEGNAEEIKSHKDQISEQVENASTADAANDVTNVTGGFASGLVMPSTSSTTSHGRGGRKSSTHKTNTDRRKAQKGEDAEKKVDAFLKNENIEHEWVSKTDDSAGFDFAYIVDGQRRFLEVKSSSDNSFILSANEYAVANNNKDIYDIAIVNGNNVTIYMAFFDGKPSLTPSDYYVFFDVNMND